MRLKGNILEKLKCDFCGELLSITPILINNEGKNMCGRCESTNTNNSFVINKVYEELATLVQFPCINNKNGCSAVLKLDNVKYHEENCPFKTKNDPNLKKFQCLFNDNCNWIGYKNDFDLHCRNKHSNCIISHPYFYKPYLDTSSEKYFIISMLDYLFLLFVKCSLPENMLYYNVLFMGSSNLAHLFNYDIIFKRDKSRLIANNIVKPFDINFNVDLSGTKNKINNLINLLGLYDDISIEIRINLRNEYCLKCNNIIDSPPFFPSNEEGRYYCVTCNEINLLMNINVQFTKPSIVYKSGGEPRSFTNFPIHIDDLRNPEIVDRSGTFSENSSESYNTWVYEGSEEEPSTSKKFSLDGTYKQHSEKEVKSIVFNERVNEILSENIKGWTYRQKFSWEEEPSTSKKFSLDGAYKQHSEIEAKSRTLSENSSDDYYEDCLSSYDSQKLFICSNFKKGCTYKSSKEDLIELHEYWFCCHGNVCFICFEKYKNRIAHLDDKHVSFVRYGINRGQIAKIICKNTLHMENCQLSMRDCHGQTFIAIFKFEDENKLFVTTNNLSYFSFRVRVTNTRNDFSFNGELRSVVDCKMTYWFIKLPLIYDTNNMFNFTLTIKKWSEDL